MRGELPVCKRCCFCLPLRYGLITWGYIRLITAILLFIGISLLSWGFLELFVDYSDYYYLTYAISGFMLFLTLTDIVLNIVFVVGGHKKNIKLLRAYYIYSYVLCVLMTLLGVASFILTLVLYKNGEIDLTFHIWLVLLEIATLLAQILLSAYVILLVRSEIIKLRSNCQFRFVNNAAESECTMRCEDEIASGEEGIDHIERARYVPKDTCQFIGYVQRNDDCY